MSNISNGDERCFFCGREQRCFNLYFLICPGLSDHDKSTGFGCFDCLLNGKFEFSHDTEIGFLDENGLTHFYNHNKEPPQKVSEGSCCRVAPNPDDRHLAAGNLANSLLRLHDLPWNMGSQGVLCARSGWRWPTPIPGNDRFGLSAAMGCEHHRVDFLVRDVLCVSLYSLWQTSRKLGLPIGPESRERSYVSWVSHLRVLALPKLQRFRNFVR